MEKLLKLLNEYFDKDGIFKAIGHNDRLEIFDLEVKDDFVRDETVISKKFGFIKRLVDNDKINIDKISEIGEIYSDCNELIRYCYIVLEDDIYPKDCSLIMLLAISENPIEDLISYLK